MAENYTDSISDLSLRIGRDERTIRNWLDKGYPLKRGKKVRFEGAKIIGGKWALNLKQCMNFINRIDEELWVSRDENIRSKVGVQKPRRTGNTALKSTIRFTQEQLTELVSSRKEMQQ